MDKSPATSPQDQTLLPVCAIFRRFLKRRGLKFTTERAMILDTVLEKDGIFEADQLLQEMKQAGHKVGRATIYRTLKHLKEANIVNEVLLDNKHAHYELSFGKEPKGHLVCMETNRVIEFPTAELEKLQKRICREHGFQAISHRFIIYGVSTEVQEHELAEEE